MITSFYQVNFKAIADLEKNELDTLVHLYLKYYDGSSAEQVILDLKTKTEVLLLKYKDELVGFSSFELYRVNYENELRQIIYSGDTIVHHEHWGQQALSSAWIKYIGKLKLQNIPIYWFLIVKGHRTYKFLPAFTKSFYPHWKIDRSDLKPFLNTLAKEKFGKFYNEVDGLVKYETSKGHMKECIAVIRDNEKKKASVNFFLESNPHYYLGDELACLCEFNDENLRPLTRRILKNMKEEDL